MDNSTTTKTFTIFNAATSKNKCLASMDDYMPEERREIPDAFEMFQKGNDPARDLSRLRSILKDAGFGLTEASADNPNHIAFTINPLPEQALLDCKMQYFEAAFRELQKQTKGMRLSEFAQSEEGPNRLRKLFYGDDTLQVHFVQSGDDEDFITLDTFIRWLEPETTVFISDWTAEVNTED